MIYVVCVMISCVYGHIVDGKACGASRVYDIQTGILGKFEGERLLSEEKGKERSLKVKEMLVETAATSSVEKGFEARIQFDTGELEYGVDKTISDFLSHNLIPKVEKYINRLVRLRVPYNTLINPFYVECYGGRFSRSFEFRGGVGILITSNLFGEETPNWVAFSLICRQDPNTGRPLFGQLNFNPKVVNPRDLESMFETTIHEIFHILGFSSHMFSQYIDSDYLPLDTNTHFVKNEGGAIIGIKTPILMREARLHFNCTDMEYVPLEDEGSTGSRNSHWERRMFGNEVMTASAMYGSKVSVFTLALLEDSGWYYSNYSLRDTFTFLKGSRCNTSNSGFECEEAFKQTCSYDYRYHAYCYVDAFNNGVMRKGANQYGECTTPRENRRARFYQSYRQNAFCFEVNLVQRDRSVDIASSGTACYESFCFRDSMGRSVRLTINNQYYYCRSDGEVISIDIEDMKGTVRCPVIDLFCMNDILCEDNCTQNGRCLFDGKCYRY